MIRKTIWLLEWRLSKQDSCMLKLREKGVLLYCSILPYSWSPRAHLFPLNLMLNKVHSKVVFSALPGRCTKPFPYTEKQTSFRKRKKRFKNLQLLTNSCSRFWNETPRPNFSLNAAWTAIKRFSKTFQITFNIYSNLEGFLLKHSRGLSQHVSCLLHMRQELERFVQEKDFSGVTVIFQRISLFCVKANAYWNNTDDDRGPAKFPN